MGLQRKSRCDPQFSQVFRTQKCNPCIHIIISARQGGFFTPGSRRKMSAVRWCSQHGRRQRGPVPIPAHRPRDGAMAASAMPSAGAGVVGSCCYPPTRRRRRSAAATVKLAGVVIRYPRHPPSCHHAALIGGPPAHPHLAPRNALVAAWSCVRPPQRRVSQWRWRPQPHGDQEAEDLGGGLARRPKRRA